MKKYLFILMLALAPLYAFSNGFPDSFFEGLKGQQIQRIDIKNSDNLLAGTVYFYLEEITEDYIVIHRKSGLNSRTLNIYYIVRENIVGVLVKPNAD